MVVKERMDLLELLRKGGMDGDVDFLREALRVLVEGIMDAEVSARTGAEYGERSPERVTQRNGYRSRAWDTRVGTMELHIPKLREGSYFPSLLEPRRRSERALLAVIQQAYVEGVSTRRVDDLIKALGCEGISTYIARAGGVMYWIRSCHAMGRQECDGTFVPMPHSPSRTSMSTSRSGTSFTL